jgi:hypothetical protein
MSAPLRTPVTAVLVLGGAALAVVGLVLWIRAHSGLGIAVIAVGLAVELGGAWHHDWLHRRHGEQPHAVWGRDDHNRPGWLGGPRHPSR